MGRRTPRPRPRHPPRRARRPYGGKALARQDDVGERSFAMRAISFSATARGLVFQPTTLWPLFSSRTTSTKRASPPSLPRRTTARKNPRIDRVRPTGSSWKHDKTRGRNRTMTTRRRRVLAVSALKGGVGKHDRREPGGRGRPRGTPDAPRGCADPQGGVGCPSDSLPDARGLAAWVTKNAAFDDSVVRAARENLDVLPAGDRLLDVEDVFREKGKEKRGPASKGVSSASSKKSTPSSSSTARPRLRFSSRTCTTSRTSSSCPRNSTFSRSRRSRRRASS